jgi:uncharacterized membrane protein YfhO
VRVENLRAPRLLLFTDSDFPGWRAYVDGAATPIIRANGAFKAVELPAGTHTVRFVFRPVAVYVGLGISGVALATAIGLIVATARTGGRRTK